MVEDKKVESTGEVARQEDASDASSSFVVARQVEEPDEAVSANGKEEPASGSEAPTEDRVGQERGEVHGISEEAAAGLEGSPPLASFGELRVLPEVLAGLEELGYREPMEVQRETFGPVMDGRHVVVQSQTGSGKTAAFGIPIMNGLVAPDRSEVQALVLCPTRELARQVAEELKVLGKHRGIEVTAVYGGTPIEPQVEALRAGTQVVVGTPGRVLDHLKRGTLEPEHLRVLVLDECDEMLSMGFQREIDDILSRLPEAKQVLLFSATVTDDVDRLLRKLPEEPVWVRLSGDFVAAKEVSHYVYLVTEGPRHRELVRLLENEQVETAIVFCNTREEVNMVASYLKQRGWKAEAISSDLSQRERERVMARMRQGRIKVLVATDVAARGLDLPHVTHVVNYTFPESAEVYIHRTGRTGRAGRAGVAISLIGPRELGSLYYMQLTYGIRPEERRLPTEQELASQREGERYAHLVETLGGEPSQEYVSLARRLWHSAKGEPVFAHLLARYFEERKPGKKGRRKAKKTSEGRRHAASESKREPPRRDRKAKETQQSKDHPDRVRLYVNLGRRDGLKGGQVCALIEEAAGIPPSAIDSARVYESHTYLTVDSKVVDRILDETKNLVHEGRKVVVERARKK